MHNLIHANSLLMRTLIYSMCLLMALSPAQAAMMGTDTLIQHRETQLNRQMLLETMEREDVRQQLIRMGVNPADAKKRIEALTASEISLMQQQMDAMPAGGSALGILLTILVILIITDILGLTDVFPRI